MPSSKQNVVWQGHTDMTRPETEVSKCVKSLLKCGWVRTLDWRVQILDRGKSQPQKKLTVKASFS